MLKRSSLKKSHNRTVTKSLDIFCSSFGSAHVGQDRTIGERSTETLE